MISAVEKVGEDGVEDVADGRRIRKESCTIWKDTMDE